MSHSEATTEVLLTPSNPVVSHHHTSTPDAKRALADVIHRRIESRLNGRIRDLTVGIRGKTVVLEGSCATYYSKQLAQHAALGVIEDEQLANEIVVAVPE